LTLGQLRMPASPGTNRGTGFGSALFDARNGFNELNRYLML
jgi:hypothetical protein